MAAIWQEIKLYGDWCELWTANFDRVTQVSSHSTCQDPKLKSVGNTREILVLSFQILICFSIIIPPFPVHWDLEWNKGFSKSKPKTIVTKKLCDTNGISEGFSEWTWGIARDWELAVKSNQPVALSALVINLQKQSLAKVVKMTIWLGGEGEGNKRTWNCELYTLLEKE